MTAPATNERPTTTESPAEVADYIKRVVDTWPPLTAEQRDRLAMLLRGGAT